MAQIIFVNTDNLNTQNPESVEVHSPNCQHVARYRQSPFFDMDAGSPEEWDSAQAFFDDYNSDFFAEAGQEGIWAIRFLPCSGLVSKTTVINTMGS